jgi:alkylhydroperoxidase family enzyme
MTTLRAPRLGEFSTDDRAILERLARRMGQSEADLLRPGIFGVQTHWPSWLEANFDHSLASYLRPGVLPPLAKEAMHVAVSMTNRCEY